MEAQHNHNKENKKYSDKKSEELDRLNEKERVIRNGVSPDYPLEKKGEGSSELVEKYAINDQAHYNSSKKDFVKTTSNFNHSDDKTNDKL